MSDVRENGLSDEKCGDEAILNVCCYGIQPRGATIHGSRYIGGRWHGV